MGRASPEAMLEAECASMVVSERGGAGGGGAACLKMTEAGREGVDGTFTAQEGLYDAAYLVLDEVVELKEFSRTVWDESLVREVLRLGGAVELGTGVEVAVRSPI
jgi:hypothetical protein